MLPAPPVCPRCQRSDWKDEPNYATIGVGAYGQYEIRGESVGGGHLIMYLDLQLVTAFHAPRVPLTHRLKQEYRHMRNDLGSKDGRGLIIQFSPSHGTAEGPWNITLSRPPFAKRVE